MNWWLIVGGMIIFAVGKAIGRGSLGYQWVEICPRVNGTKGRASCRGTKLVESDPDLTCQETHYWVHRSALHNVSIVKKG